MTPQIPWAHLTKVTHYNLYDRIRLQHLSLEALILEDGNVYVEHDSRIEINNYLDYNDSLTLEFLAYCRGEDSEPSLGLGEDWVELAHPALPRIPRGKKEWRPGVSKEDQGSHWKLLRRGSSAGFEGWNGERLEYVIFRTDEKKEGTLIEWRSGAFEVWMGNFDDFLDSQLFPRDEDELMMANREFFENGILWAMAEFGLLSDPEKIESELPEWVKVVINNDPDLLWSEVVTEMDKVFGILPWELQTAIREWKVRRMKEMEKATGQKYLWPRVYPGKER